MNTDKNGMGDSIWRRSYKVCGVVCCVKIDQDYLSMFVSTLCPAGQSVAPGKRVENCDCNMGILPYNPGVIPTKPSPLVGERLILEVEGLPPYKDRSRSIRNINHPRYEAFVALRDAATVAMDGRAWSFGPIELNMTISAPALHSGRTLNDYLGGVMDTIGGSSGFTFTYLPIVYEDDCQVSNGRNQWIQSTSTSYRIDLVFLNDEGLDL